jgi:hypothetical protein
MTNEDHHSSATYQLLETVVLNAAVDLKANDMLQTLNTTIIFRPAKTYWMDYFLFFLKR